jgi:hypothetical protein
MGSYYPGFVLSIAPRPGYIDFRIIPRSMAKIIERFRRSGRHLDGNTLFLLMAQATHGEIGRSARAKKEAPIYQRRQELLDAAWKEYSERPSRDSSQRTLESFRLSKLPAMIKHLGKSSDPIERQISKSLQGYKGEEGEGMISHKQLQRILLPSSRKK